MPFEPKKITREHVLEAIKEIEENKLELTPSTQWDVIIDGKAYPPKDVLRYAHKQMNGEIIWDVTGGEATNTYLDELGFLIRAKNDRADQIRSLIQEYKKTLDLSEFSNKDEKWYFVQRYKDNVDPTNPNFAEAFGSIKYANFAYRIAPAVIKEILSNEPVRYQQCIIKLFNEDVDLTERIKMFIQEVEAIYRKMHPEHNNSSHHDERTIATFLTLRDPKRFTFFMDTFYRNFCGLMGVKPKATKGEKYVHYLKYMQEFTSQYVDADKELVSLASQSIPSDAYPDSDHLLLSQDIVFRLLGKDSTSVNDNLDAVKIDESDWMSTNSVQSTPRITYPLNQILYGPPGTGKTYNSINLAVEISDQVFWGTITDKSTQRIEITKRYRELVKEGRIVFTTFHQSMSYEDFIEGIKPITNEDQENSLTYEVVPGIFKRLCDRAAMSDDNNFEQSYSKLIADLARNENEFTRIKTPTGREFGISLNSNNNLNMHLGTDFKQNACLTKDIMIAHIIRKNTPEYFKGYYQGVITLLKDKYGFQDTRIANNNFVLIIDEINRGNVSQVFGELITLIEPDKRTGNAEAIEITLPYSKDRFSVPSNLYIIGTMNTADRSVEALDTALRRRFSFYEMTPDYSLLAGKEEQGIDLTDLLSTINQRIEGLLDKDHAIGHSYFLRVANGESTLKSVFFDEIIPLLQEYFYGNFGRIELVLGKGFVNSSPVTQSIFAKPSPDNDEFNDHVRYTLVRRDEMDDAAFQKALRVLMKASDEA